MPNELQNPREPYQLLTSGTESGNHPGSSLLAMISHEIRTALHCIIGNSELMLKTPLDEKQHGYAKNTMDSATDVIRLVNEILDLSRMESGQMPMQLAPFDPDQLVQDVVRQCRYRLENKRITIIIQSSPFLAQTASPSETPWGMGDRLRIQQVLINLITNAIKFTPAGSITVGCSFRYQSAAHDTTQLVYTVSDTGVGISKEAQKHIFTSYYQVNTASSTNYGGIGLGLAISKQIVEMMGGEISCVSEPDQGSTFTFRFPCQQAEKPLNSAPEQRQIPSPPPPPPLTQPSSASRVRVLVAEDMAINQELVSIMLEKRGCEVMCVENGLMALETLTCQSYDLVLMDCTMPLLNGYDAATALRALELTTNRPRCMVIALTANADNNQQARCLAAGMDDCLVKPFTTAEFDDVVGRCIQRLQSTKNSQDLPAQ